MTVPASYKGLIKHHGRCSPAIQSHFESLPSLVTHYVYDVAIAYSFLKLEKAYNRTLYGGVRKVRKVHSEVAQSILDKQHITRDGFLELYKNTFDRELPDALRGNLSYAEKTRDRIIHGKEVDDARARRALTDVLDFAGGMESELLSAFGFSPFSDMRGLTGKAKSLDKSTSRLVMKGLGFAVG